MDDASTTKLVKELEKGLGKKKEFQACATRLTELLETKYVSASPAVQDALLTAVSRASVLLKTRYGASMIGFWVAGEQLFQTALIAIHTAEGTHNSSSSSTGVHREKIQDSLELARATVNEEESASDAPPGHQPARQRERYLFEGQLSGPEERPPEPAVVLHTLMDSILSQTAGEPTPAALQAAMQQAFQGQAAAEAASASPASNPRRAAPASTARGPPRSQGAGGGAGARSSGGEGGPGGAARGRAAAGGEPAADAPPPAERPPPEDGTTAGAEGGSGTEDGDEAMQQAEGGADGNPEETAPAGTSIPAMLQEALRNADGDVVQLEELLDEAMQEAIMLTGEVGNPAARAPPASKKAVAELPVVEVTAALQHKLGAEMQCAICRDELELEVKVQVLPCSASHCFHPACLAPWLKDHNSCPVCRHELPTDNIEYELKKERDKEEAAERRGAANAERGGEFMYL